MTLAVFLEPANASAQGLTGGLDGLAEVMAILWGICGILAAVLVVVATRLRKEHPGSLLAPTLVVVSVIYALIAIGLMFVEMHGSAAKFAGTVGFVVLFAAVGYITGNHPRVRIVANTVLVLLLATLLVIPTEFWKVPLLSFDQIVYVDKLATENSAVVLRTHYGYRGRLALDDGRLLIQTAHIPERPVYAGKSGPTYSNGVAVVLKPTTMDEPGQWFEIDHYRQAYVSGARHNGQRARYVLPLSTTTVDVYKLSMRTLGYLVDDSGGVDYEDLLLELMTGTEGSWDSSPDRSNPGNKYHWGPRLIELGRIDIHSSTFLDEAYRRATAQALLALLDFGLDIDARNSRGNTLLHVSAARPDYRLLYGLLERNVDPTIENDEGLTAAGVMKAKADVDPGTYRYERFVEMLEQARR